MLPRLTAEESKQAATRHAVGAAGMTPDSARSTLQGWTDAASGIVVEPSTAPLTGAAAIEKARAAGVAVRFRKRPQPSEGPA